MIKRRITTGKHWRTSLVLTIAFLTSVAPGACGRNGDDDPPPTPRVELPDESQYKPSPADGKGTVTVAPKAVPTLEPTTLTFVYTAAAEGIAPGGGVVCLVSSFWGWTPPQLEAPTLPGYFTVTCSNSQVKLDLSIDHSSQAVYALLGGERLEQGDTLTFVYGYTSGGKHPSAQGHADRYAERGERFFFRVDGDGDGYYVALSNQPHFDVLPAEAAQIVTFGPSGAHVDQTVELSVAVLDRAYNLVESFTGPIKLAAHGTEVELPGEVRIRAEDRGAIRVSCRPTRPGAFAIEATDPSGRLVGSESNPTVAVAPGDERYTLFWGDLQGHSNYSDGTAHPRDWYRYARDVSRLDVVALTDHDFWGYEPLSTYPTNWQYILDTCRQFHDPGRFVTIPGYEWTNWTYGHMHVLYEREEARGFLAWNDPQSDDPEKLWRELGDCDCLTVPHHTGGGPIPFHWKYYHSTRMPLVEVTSVHGVSEMLGHPRSVYPAVESGMVQTALARGYRLGLVGSGDTHDGHPGMRQPQNGVTGLAGIYATELTREAVFEALRARRVYATTGCRPILRFHLGDTPMGGVATMNGPAQERKLSIAVLAEAPVAEITIVKNNRDVAHHRPGQVLVSWGWTDPEPAMPGDYYYARVQQADNQWAYASPIWIEIAAGAGDSNE